jgi:hypothetical protein
MNVSRSHEGDLPGVYIPGSRNGSGAMQTARPCLAAGIDGEHYSGCRTEWSGFPEEIVVRGDTP